MDVLGRYITSLCKRFQTSRKGEGKEIHQGGKNNDLEISMAKRKVPFKLCLFRLTVVTASMAPDVVFLQYLGDFDEWKELTASSGS